MDQISVQLVGQFGLQINKFWNAITLVLEYEWEHPRKHFLTKGIGVYALTSIAADLYTESAIRGDTSFDRAYFITKLSDFADDFDWSNSGPLRGLGGESGAAAAAQMLRDLRTRNSIRVVTNG